MSSIFECCIKNDAIRLMEILDGLSPEERQKILIQKNEDEYTYLHTAVRFNSYRVLKKFMELGGDANTIDMVGRSLLQHAAFRGSLECIEILLDAGADIKYANDSHRSTPFEYAIRGTNLECLELLVRRCGYIYEMRGSPLLHFAAICGDKDCMKFLIQYGSDPYALDCIDCVFLDCIIDENLKKEMEDYVKEFETLNIKEPEN